MKPSSSTLQAASLPAEPQGKPHWERFVTSGKEYVRAELLPCGFPCGSAGKETACSAGDLGLIPELGRSPGEGKGYPLQYSGLENSIVHGVAKNQS